MRTPTTLAGWNGSSVPHITSANQQLTAGSYILEGKVLISGVWPVQNDRYTVVLTVKYSDGTNSGVCGALLNCNAPSNDAAKTLVDFLKENSGSELEGRVGIYFELSFSAENGHILTTTRHVHYLSFPRLEAVLDKGRATLYRA